MQDAVAIAKQDAIAILGVTPTSPETGYGYIKTPIENLNNGDLGISVERFVEKPNIQTAEHYLKEGSYFWNGGMFVLKTSLWLAALKEFRPDIATAAEDAWKKKERDESAEAVFIRPNKDAFNSIPSESIDYAVIEKCPNSKYPIKMVELNAGWNDLGAWDAVWQVGKHDQDGNVVSGDALLSNTHNSLVYATSRLVSAVGINNLVIVETADAVLVADRKNSQDVKAIVRVTKA
jgi:mannose-1-phosphate guanylyltransferase / mannose-6-phosphate isomerase